MKGNNLENTLREKRRGRGEGETISFLHPKTLEPQACLCGRELKSFVLDVRLQLSSK